MPKTDYLFVWRHNRRRTVARGEDDRTNATTELMHRTTR
jgi:hypothetical protein